MHTKGYLIIHSQLALSLARNFTGWLHPCDNYNISKCDTNSLLISIIPTLKYWRYEVSDLEERFEQCHPG
jgi:hypothetical protein